MQWLLNAGFYWRKDDPFCVIRPSPTPFIQHIRGSFDLVSSRFILHPNKTLLSCFVCCILLRAGQACPNIYWWNAEWQNREDVERMQAENKRVSAVDSPETESNHSLRLGYLLQLWVSGWMLYEPDISQVKKLCNGISNDSDWDTEHDDYGNFELKDLNWRNSSMAALTEWNIIIDVCKWVVISELGWQYYDYCTRGCVNNKWISK